jgi:hypothetical protein
MTLTQTFNNKLDTYTQQLPGILDNFKKNYILYNKNPDYNEYQQLYASSKGNLDSIMNNIYSLNNDILSEINHLNQSNNHLNTDLTKQKKINDNLKKLLTSVTGKNNGSFKLIHNSSEMYKSQLVLNVNMAIGVFLLIGAMIKLYKK